MRYFWVFLVIVVTIVAGFIASQYHSSALLDGDRTADIVYLGVFGLLVASLLTHRGIKLSHMVRSALVWVIVFLVLMIGYNIRYELQDIGAKITAGLIPASPLSAFDDEGRATVTLRQMESGHFAADAEVNGTTVHFLIDTGASRIVLTERDARRIGIDTVKLHYNYPVSTANGRTHHARIALDSIRLGTIRRESLYAYVTRDGELDISLLGMDFLNRLSGYSVRGDRFILLD
ncbi:MAG: Clan AA aspartic protease [Candidatus Tokpelaia hoelldobleri]|uniref:Clan AA aspartic protease n=1 Tax=Candidatus Tokpelaia hoelldobleri TaxID=1902579 RepID=A0A1U9JVB0_9HYPH|nr:MAG: Clan AA aspartic protease [Candidatus Tokpelaia hoelldoblerii]